MSVHLAAIIGLLLILLAATLRPVNVGAIALVGTFVVGTFVAGEDIKTLYSGFPVDLFVLLFGVTYLFGIASVNGTIQWVVSRVAAILGAKAAFVPLGDVSGDGDRHVRRRTRARSDRDDGSSVVRTREEVRHQFAARRTDGGSRIMRRQLLAHQPNRCDRQWHGGAQWPSRSSHCRVRRELHLNVMLGLVIYVSFGGAELLRRRRGSTSAPTANVPDAAKEMNLVQLVTLLCIVLAAVGALVFRFDLGMLALSAAVVLHLLFPSTSDEAPRKIGWSTIVLVCGVVTYMAFLQRTGALKVVGDSVVSRPRLGVLLICFVAAITSVFAASPAFWPS